MTVKTKGEINELSLAKVVSRLIDENKWYEARDLFENLYIENDNVIIAKSDKIKELLEKLIEFFVKQKRLGYASTLTKIAGRKLNKNEILPKIKELFKKIKTSKCNAGYILELIEALDDYELEKKYLRAILNIIIYIENDPNSHKFEARYELESCFFSTIIKDKYFEILEFSFDKLLKNKLYYDIKEKIIKYLKDPTKSLYLMKLYEHYKKKKYFSNQLELAKELGIETSNDEIMIMIDKSIKNNQEFALKLIKKLPMEYQIKQIDNLEIIYEKSFTNKIDGVKYLYWLRDFIDNIIDCKIKLEKGGD